MWNLTPTSRHPYPTIRHKRVDFFNFNTYAIEKELFKYFSQSKLFSKFCKTLSNGSESNSSVQFVGFSVLLQLPNLLTALLLIFIFIFPKYGKKCSRKSLKYLVIIYHKKIFRKMISEIIRLKVQQNFLPSESTPIELWEKNVRKNFTKSQ